MPAQELNDIIQKINEGQFQIVDEIINNATLDDSDMIEIKKTAINTLMSSAFRYVGEGTDTPIFHGAVKFIKTLYGGNRSQELENHLRQLQHAVILSDTDEVVKSFVNRRDVVCRIIGEITAISSAVELKNIDGLNVKVAQGTQDRVVTTLKTLSGERTSKEYVGEDNDVIKKYLLPIVEIALNSPSTEIRIDIENNHVGRIGGTVGALGSFDPTVNIVFASNAAALLNDSKMVNARGSLLHEMCHLVDHSLSEPEGPTQYFSSSNQNFREIVQNLYLNSDETELPKIIKDGLIGSYTNGMVDGAVTDNMIHETLVRGLQHIAHDKSKGLQELKLTASKLVKFYDEVFLQKCNDAIKAIEDPRNHAPECDSVQTTPRRDEEKVKDIINGNKIAIQGVKVDDAEKKALDKEQHPSSLIPKARHKLVNQKVPRKTDGVIDGDGVDKERGALNEEQPPSNLIPKQAISKATDSSNTKFAPPGR